MSSDQPSQASGSIFKENEMRLFTRSLAAAMLTTGYYLSAPAASVLAQTPPRGPATSAPELSDQKVNAAADALKRVTDLQKDYQQRVAEAEVPAEQERIVAEAQNELRKAVTEQGLSVEEYVSILEAARDDPAIRGKILQRILPSGK
jgi:hypothetical protein